MFRRTLIGIGLTWLLVSSGDAAAQETPARARIIGPQALTGGVLRCEVNDRIQLILESTSSKLQNVDLSRFRPSVTSSNEDVVPAVVDDDPRSSHVLCASDGRAEVTYTIGNLKLCVAVLVGTARKEDSSPCSSGLTTIATSSGASPKVQRPDKPIRGRFQVPEWLDHNGVMSCERGNDWQLVLDVTTEKLEQTDLTFYPPRVHSSNAAVVHAVVNEDPRSIQIKCASDGRAELTLQIADLVICLPVIVSADGAARDATPCTTKTATVTAAAGPVRAATVPERGRPANASAAPTTKTVETPAQASPTRAPSAQPERGQLAANKPRVPAVPVTNLKAYAGYGNVQLTWKAAPGATGYSIHRRDVNATEAISLTGDVHTNGTGLIADTVYFDSNVTANQQYAYYVFPYFRDPNDSTYYFPPAQYQTASIVATARDATGLPWLPADWKTAPVVIADSTAPFNGCAILSAGHHITKERTCIRQAEGMLVVNMRPRSGSVGWVAFLDPHAYASPPLLGIQTFKGMCKPRSVGLLQPPNLPGQNQIGIGNTLRIPVGGIGAFCVAIVAVYADKVGSTGTPEVSITDFKDRGDAVLSDAVFLMYESVDGKWVLIPRDKYNAAF